MRDATTDLHPVTQELLRELMKQDARIRKNLDVAEMDVVLKVARGRVVRPEIRMR